MSLTAVEKRYVLATVKLAIDSSIYHVMFPLGEGLEGALNFLDNYLYYSDFTYLKSWGVGSYSVRWDTVSPQFQAKLAEDLEDIIASAGFEEL